MIKIKILIFESMIFFHITCLLNRQASLTPFTGARLFKMIKSIALTIILLFIISFPAHSLSILLVNDNNYNPERIEIIQTAITNSGYSFTNYDTELENSSPSYATMSGFDLVIWYTGNTDNEAIMQYIDQGGMLWVQGLDFLYDKYNSTPVSFFGGDFVYDYLGISEYYAQSHVDDGTYSDGVPLLDLVTGNPIFSLNPIQWTYETMWYVDACTPTSVAQNLYRMGPASYELSNYYSGIYLEKGDGKIVTFTFETARINTQQNTDALFLQGLDYFAQFAGGVVHVTNVVAYGEGDATIIAEDAGTLQMYANVLPENATNPSITWSTRTGTATATITADGLLMATGSNMGNGTVWVIAKTSDGSDVSDSLEITISNQGAGAGSFEILLVNDNNYGSDRYMVIDTTIQNLGYVHDVYNTVVTGNRPDFSTLSNYGLVIWYTGNDASDLYLWDISDTLNYKFNSDLIDYIDNGGNVWLQGLDFMYDIKGNAPNEFSLGQFIHDYMGITKYVAQSYVNDGGEGLPQLDVRPSNGVCSFNPIKWVYSTLWYADAFDVTPYTKVIYKMGPSSYLLNGYVNSFLKKLSGGSVMTWAFETARIDTRTNTETIFGEVLQYYENVMGVDEIVNTNIMVKVWPNPASNKANFEYELQNPAAVMFHLYDITGSLVSTINIAKQEVGKQSYSISKEELNLVSGVYFYEFIFDGNSYTGKVFFN